MADDNKTEKATPKKIEDARKKGNVPKSREVVGFAGLLIAIVVLIFYLKYVTVKLEEFFQFYYQFIPKEVTKEVVYQIVIVSAKEILILFAPIFIALILVAIISNVAQFGFLLVPLKFDIMKIFNIVAGLKRLFSPKTFVTGFITTFKVFIAFGVGAYIFYSFLSELPKLELMPLFEQIKWFEDKAILLIFSMLGVFFIFAAIDFAYQRYTYFKSLRMTKQEVKDEHKQQDGNPEVKARMRQIMMKRHKEMMMSDVSKADVVVTNPTHYAVALRYDRTQDEAPRVVAKGIDHMAIRIKEIARENDIMIVENPPLARELYKSVEIGDYIPQKLFKAVAEILAYVYRTKNGLT